MTGLPDRLVYERNRIRTVLGRRWKAAMLLSSGRLAFDFGTLLATIRATGVKPNPSLVLLAYAVAGLLALIPITPGGLGHRRGGAERAAHPGRRARRRRRRGHVGLPDHLVLAAHLRGPVRLLRLPAALREAGARRRRGGRHRGRGTGHGLTLGGAVGVAGDACRMRESSHSCTRGHGNPCGPTGCPSGSTTPSWASSSTGASTRCPGWAPRVPDIQQLLVKDGPKRMLRENPYAEWYLNSMQIKGSPTAGAPRPGVRRRLPLRQLRPDLRRRVVRGQPRRRRRPLPRGGRPLRRAHDEAPRRLRPVALLDAAPGQGRLPRPPRPGGRPDRGGPGQADAHGAVLLRRLRLALQRRRPHPGRPTPCWPPRTTPATSSTSRRTGASSSTATQPSVLWNDISWPTDPRLPELFAYYYNAVEEGVINDRWKEPGLPRNAVDGRHRARGRRRGAGAVARSSPSSASA